MQSLFPEKNSVQNTIYDEELLALRGKGFREAGVSYIEDMLKSGRREKLLLHSCCAPCSSACLEYLSLFFDITDFFYNPNISDKSEYKKRAEELERLITCYNYETEGKTTALSGHPREADGLKGERLKAIEFVEGEYEPGAFLEAVRGFEKEPEGGRRCIRCFRLRLYKTAEYAAANGFDCFTTTLTISPMKNAALLNHLGQEAALEYGVRFLPSDFKKKDGYKRSIELSAAYGLYRQDFCGCAFSKAEREKKKNER